MIAHQITNYSQLLLEREVSAPLTNEKMEKYPDRLHVLNCLALSDVVKNYADGVMYIWSTVTLTWKGNKISE